MRSVLSYAYGLLTVGVNAQACVIYIGVCALSTSTCVHTGIQAWVLVYVPWVHKRVPLSIYMHAREQAPLPDRFCAGLPSQSPQALSSFNCGF